MGGYLGEVLDDLRGDNTGGSHVSPFMLCQAFGYLKPGFEGSEDQDPEEFLCDFFNQLREEHDTAVALAMSKGEDTDQTAQQGAFVESIYEGVKGTRVRIHIN